MPGSLEDPGEPLKNRKHEAYAFMLGFRGIPAMEAWKESGVARNPDTLHPDIARRKAQEVQGRPGVAARIDFFRKKAISQEIHAEIGSRDAVLRELTTCYQAAREENKLSEALSALKLIGTELGMFQKTVRVQDDRPQLSPFEVAALKGSVMARLRAMFPGQEVDHVLRNLGHGGERGSRARAAADEAARAPVIDLHPLPEAAGVPHDGSPQEEALLDGGQPGRQDLVCGQ